MMVRYLTAIGRTVVGIVANIIWAVRLMWYLGFLFFAGILVFDLFRIPISVNSSHKYAPEQTLWAKKTPEEETRLKEFQEHCRHIYVHNSIDAFYCPLCRKKLRKERPYIWKI